MFCSKCGRTIPQDQNACAHCGTRILANEFSAASYISSLPAADQSAAETEEKARGMHFTRTTYTSMTDENEGDVFRRTSYRPVYQEPEAEKPEKNNRNRRRNRRHNNRPAQEPKAEQPKQEAKAEPKPEGEGQKKTHRRHRHRNHKPNKE